MTGLTTPEVGLLLLEVGLPLLGWGALVWVLLRARSTDALAQPLNTLPIPPTDYPLIYPLLAWAGYLFLVALAANIGVYFTGGTSESPPIGSPAYFARMAAVHGAALLCVPLFAWLLPKPRHPTRLPLLPLLGIAGVTVILVLPVLLVQMQAGEVILRLLRPAMDPPRHEVLRALAMNEFGWVGTVILVAGAVVVAPLVEELIFRGLLLDSLLYHTRNAWLAIIASSFCFGFVHAQPQDILPLVTLGISLGILRYRYRSLMLCIVMHALFNARTIWAALLTIEVRGAAALA